MFTQRMQGMGDAALMAMKQLSQIVHRQAVVMGYGDAFFMLTMFYFGLSLLVMLLNKPPAPAAGGQGTEDTERAHWNARPIDFARSRGCHIANHP